MPESVTCLCMTFGRFKLLRESLTCFLAQDTDQCELLIWNFHDVPIKLAEPYPRVRLINEPHNLDNIDSWYAAIDRVKTTFVRAWLDDDLYLPWTVSQALANIGKAPAVTHRGRYQLRKHVKFAYYDEDHRDGANITLRTGVARYSGIDEQATILIPPGTIFLHHDSLALPYWVLSATEEEDCDWRKAHLLIHLKDRPYRNLVWRDRQRDTGEGLALTPAPINHHLDVLKRCCPELPGELAKYGL